MATPFEGRPLRRHTLTFLADETPPTTPPLSWRTRIRTWCQIGKDKKDCVNDDAREKGDPASPSAIDPREQLYLRMVGDQPPDETLEVCWSWYLKFLDARIREAWVVVLVPTIRGLASSYIDHDEPQIAKVYEILVVIAEAIMTRSEFSLDNIVAELKTKEELINPASQEKLRHLVWCFCGHLTMLYDPEVENPIDDAGTLELALRRPFTYMHARNRHRGAVLTSFREETTGAEDKFSEMLGQFGAFLPKPSCFSSTDWRLGPLGDIHHLNVAYLCIDGLQKVAKIRIEWVNTLESHLQLNQRKRVLQLYRFPAFCKILYRDGKGFLEQVFLDYNESQVKEQGQEENLTFSDYLREIMLSYRLLFGIDPPSRQTFRDELENWQHETLNSSPCSHRRLYDRDPLLQQLCATSGRSKIVSELLEALDGEETSVNLYALEDFPFLGKRLAELQRFAIWHKPNSPKILWQDRRDVKDWWIVWTALAVLLIGGGTVVLQFFQLLFQVWSFVISFRTPGGG